MPLPPSSMSIPVVPLVQVVQLLVPSRVNRVVLPTRGYFYLAFVCQRVGRPLKGSERRKGGENLDNNASRRQPTHRTGGSSMFASQVRSKDEILAIRRAEREYAKKLVLAQETVKLVREELANCYMEHGVNHKMACKALREEYGRLVMDPTHGAGLPVSLSLSMHITRWAYRSMRLTSGARRPSRSCKLRELETAEIDMYRAASEAPRAQQEETKARVTFKRTRTRPGGDARNPNARPTRRTRAVAVELLVWIMTLVGG